MALTDAKIAWYKERIAALEKEKDNAMRLRRGAIPPQEEANYRRIEREKDEQIADLYQRMNDEI